MRRISILIMVLAFSWLSSANADDKNLLKKISKGDTYFQVLLEKPNGVDRRANVMPAAIIKMFEDQGKCVRPCRKDSHISYWGFLKNGMFSTVDIQNAPQKARMTHAQAHQLFSMAPENTLKWEIGKDLIIGGKSYSVKELTANSQESNGKAGEIEIAFLKDGKSVYFYVGNFLQ